jgi:DNA-directed RNA polymerase subunit F
MSEVISETPITMAELKESLQKIKKRDAALNFRAEKTEEYLEQFKIVSEKDAKEIQKKIEELNIPRMRPEYILKLIDILPITPDDVQLVLQAYTITVTKENIKKVADVLEEYTK